MWIFSVSCKGKIRCPICRQDVPFRVIYDFSHPVIQLMKFLYVIELFLYGAVPILQGTAVLAFPLLLPCSKDFLVFATHYSIHSFLDIFFISEKQQIFFRYLHLILLAVYIDHTERVEPFTRFVEGRSIIYANTVSVSTAFASTAFASTAFASTASQPATNALEGNKPRRGGRRRR